MWRTQRDLCSTLVLMVAALACAMAVCPIEYHCQCGYDNRGRKRVLCAQGGMVEFIPSNRLNYDIEVLIVTAPPNNPNNLYISRIFYLFTKLEEVHITNSYVPAIGENTFWNANSVRILNLTNNNITYLQESNFRGLSNLQHLHLDGNKIGSMPSTTFQHLKDRLRTLTMSNNRIFKIEPGLFLNISGLEFLDLSYNPLKTVDPDIFRDILFLKSLRLSGCGLTLFDPRSYDYLRFLESLDLSHNKIEYFSQHEFRRIQRLKQLYLEGNRIANILEYTFSGLNLVKLSIANNRLRHLSPEIFGNMTVLDLDISNNDLKLDDRNLLMHVSSKLQRLNIGGNRIKPYTLVQLLSPIRDLQQLSLAKMELSWLEDGTFNNNERMKTLNLSFNYFSSLQPSLFRYSINLETLDLSYNQFYGLDQNLIDRFDELFRLHRVFLHANPWSCDLCHIPALLAWFNNSKIFQYECRYPDMVDCLRCQTPHRLRNRAIKFLSYNDLEDCSSWASLGFGGKNKSVLEWVVSLF